jgi:flagellar brake protein
MSADLLLLHPSEITALLHELIQEGGSLELAAPTGPSLALLVALLDDKTQSLLLRLPGLRASAPDWLLQGPVHAHALLAKVRIDFDLSERHLGELDGLPVLRLALPTQMRRHQRRQAYRVKPLSKHHPRVSVMLPERPRPVRLSTQDLSTGGVALLWPKGSAPPESIDQAELELEREVRVAVQLRLEHCRLADDGSWVLGCAFVQLSAQAERLLTQHLNQLQRRHRLLGR